MPEDMMIDDMLWHLSMVSADDIIELTAVLFILLVAYGYYIGGKKK